MVGVTTEARRVPLEHGALDVRREEWWTVTMRVRDGDQVVVVELTVEADDLVTAVGLAESQTANLVETTGARHRGVLVHRPGVG